MRLPKELSVAFEALDAEHREVFDLLDAVAQAARVDDTTAARSALARLGDGLAAHFSCEESSMEATRYPERGRHKSAHDLFMQDFAQLVAEMERAGLSVPVVEWLCVRLPEWFKFHVQVNDAPLGRYLASKRFRPEATGRAEKPRSA